MKNLIYQVKVGPNPPPFYDICIDSAKRYCEKYNIDYIVQTDPILKIRPLNSHRSTEAVERLGYLPIYEKENAFNYLDDYDNICIVDADIYIRDNAPNIFDELGDATFGGVTERSMPLTPEYIRKIKGYSKSQYSELTDVDWKWDDKSGGEFYNMGLMLFSNKLKDYLNGETPEQFIRRPEFERFVNGEKNWKWATDQTLLNYWVKESGMKVKNLDWRWNTLFKAVRDDQLEKSYFIHFFLANNLPKKGAEIPQLIQNLDKAKELKGHR